MTKITSIDIIKGVSVVDTSPFVLRSFSVHPPLILRSISVRAPFGNRRTNGESTENDRRLIENRTRTDREPIEERCGKYTIGIVGRTAILFHRKLTS